MAVQMLGEPAHTYPGSTVQVWLHPSPGTVLQSSHPSPPLTTQFPQTGVQTLPMHRPLQHWLADTQAPPVAAHGWQVPPWQTPLEQSVPTAHGCPFAQGGQVPPPQSTPVSLPFFTPSEQDGVMQSPPKQLPLQHCRLVVHTPPLAVQAAWHTPPEQDPLQHWLLAAQPPPAGMQDWQTPKAHDPLQHWLLVEQAPPPGVQAEPQTLVVHGAPPQHWLAVAQGPLPAV
jgi:hypothetical protein